MYLLLKLLLVILMAMLMVVLQGLNQHVRTSLYPPPQIVVLVNRPCLA
jgi:hypothetical protein